MHAILREDRHISESTDILLQNLQLELMEKSEKMVCMVGQKKS